MVDALDCAFPNTPSALVEMRDLLAEAYAERGQYPRWSVARVQHWFHSHRSMMTRKRPGFWHDHARLWRDPAGRLLGFLASESDGDTFVVTSPGGRDLEPRMLAWHAAEWHRRDQDARIVHHCPDARLESALWERGYAPAGEAARVYSYDLLAMDLDYALPPGYVARGMSTEDDFGRQAELTRAVFPRSEYTPEAHACLREAPDYDPALDVAVIEPSGRHVAIACAMLDRRNRVGSFEPVGTIAGCRRLGLGRAAVFEAFRRLRDRGAVRAVIVTGAEPYFANRFYEALGPVSVLPAPRWIAPRDSGPDA